ncbi:hypothetical protein D9M69_681860 [compost metagenome]
MHPAVARAAPDAVAQPEPGAEHQCRHGQEGGEAQQLARHQQQALTLRDRLGGHHRQVDEDARQIEQPGKPAGNENNVKRFDPEHGGSLVVAAH